MAHGGFEWLVIDREHTPIGVHEQMRLVQIIELAGVVPLVRVGRNDSLLIKQAMDAGAHGVIVPMVNSAQEAQDAVEAAYYPPRGRRGVGLSRAQRYGMDFQAYVERMSSQTVVIVQIEHIEAVEHLREIVRTPGVDGFLVGPYDLSGSLGCPGDWNDPSVKEALEQVEAVIQEDIVPAGFHVVHSDRSELESRVQSGYRIIAYGDDLVWLAEKVREEAGVAINLLGQES
jgi:2-dehydro-3-deoxyglucarate aldolase